MAVSMPGFHDSPVRAEPAYPLAAGSYQIDLPQDWLDEQGTMLEWVIGFAFDTLHARHLDLRIVADPGAS